MAECPKASFHVQFNEQERLTFASSKEKRDPSGENIVAQLPNEEREKIGRLLER